MTNNWHYAPGRDFLKLTLLLFVSVLILPACYGQADNEADARLRVTQQQTRCCYIEGQISFLQLFDEAGETIVDLEFRAPDSTYPALDKNLSPGSYTLRSWQRPCSGNCGLGLDPPTDQCEIDLDLSAGMETFITAAFTPGEGCTISRTDQPLESAVPDRFAFREELMLCGEDFPREIELGIQGRSPVSTCFLETYENGERAEMTAWVRISERAVRPRIYRILPNRRIEVFVPPDNPRQNASWFYYQCTGLVADEGRVFSLQSCSDPEPIAEN